MGLEKEIETSYGIPFDYHKITDVHIIIGQDKNIQLRMTVASYADQEARNQNKEPLKTVHIIDGADFALTPFYMLLKAKFEKYGDANDVFEEGQNGTAGTQPAVKRDVIYTSQTLRGKLISQRRENAEEPETQDTENQAENQSE